MIKKIKQFNLPDTRLFILMKIHVKPRLFYFPLSEIFTKFRNSWFIHLRHLIQTSTFNYFN